MKEDKKDDSPLKLSLGMWHEEHASSWRSARDLTCWSSVVEMLHNVFGFLEKVVKPADVLTLQFSSDTPAVYWHTFSLETSGGTFPLNYLTQNTAQNNTQHLNIKSTFKLPHLPFHNCFWSDHRFHIITSNKRCLDEVMFHPNLS